MPSSAWASRWELFYNFQTGEVKEKVVHLPRHELPVSMRRAKADNLPLSITREYRKIVEYVYDPKTMRMSEKVHWIEPLTGVEHIL